MNIEVEKRSRNLLLTVLARILKPLVRLMLEHDIKYTMVLEELKRVYVTVANEEFKLANGEQTDSRITVLTGVHRKDVKRIRSEESGLITKEPRRLSLTSQLIALWLKNPDNLDPEGNPTPLPRLMSNGGEHSFEALVAHVSKDIRARPILDEWLNLGLVTLDENDYVHLNMQAFIPNQNLEEKLFYLSMNVHDHLATAVNNVQANKPAFLERCIYYNNLTEENINTLHKAAREYGMESLTKLNRLAMDLKAGQDSTVIKDQELKRMNFGMYFHSSNIMINPESGAEKSEQDAINDTSSKPT